jgi:hypothetical protein
MRVAVALPVGIMGVNMIGLTALLAAASGQPLYAQADEWRWRMFVRASIQAPM